MYRDGRRALPAGKMSIQAAEGRKFFSPLPGVEEASSPPEREMVENESSLLKKKSLGCLTSPCQHFDSGTFRPGVLTDATSGSSPGHLAEAKNSSKEKSAGKKRNLLMILKGDGEREKLRSNRKG